MQLPEVTDKGALHSLTTLMIGGQQPCQLIPTAGTIQVPHPLWLLSNRETGDGQQEKVPHSVTGLPQCGS